MNLWGVRETREEHEDKEREKGRESRQHKGQYGLNEVDCVVASIVASSATSMAYSLLLFYSILSSNLAD